LNLRPPGPEPAPEESHGVTSGGTVSQAVEKTEVAPAADSDTVAPIGYGETPFGAPVVRDLPPDPGPHERLLTVREVASRLGVSTALVYKLCERKQLRSLRIGGALRFQEEAVQSFLETLDGALQR
jgi:excisionase family DNA binding protein